MVAGRPEAASRCEPARVLYIVGSGRSGSTLVELVLGQLRAFISVGELKYVWRKGLVRNRLCGCGEPFLACPFWKRVGEEAFGGWSRVDGERLARLREQATRPAALAPAPLRDPASRAAAEEYGAALAAVYRAALAVAGARIVVDSSKALADALLVARLPEARASFLHLVRDSRGVAASWKRRVARPEVVDGEAYLPVHRPEVAAARWLVKNLAARAVGASDGTRLLLRYESFVRSPAESVRRVVRHVGEEAAEEELAFLSGDTLALEPTHSVSGNPLRFRRESLRLAVDERWRESLSRRERALVLGVTWPLLAAYARAEPTRLAR
jgi:hypothetical protein